MSSTYNLHIPPSLQPGCQLLFTDHKIRTYLIKAVRAIEILSQLHILHLSAYLVLLLLLLPLLRTIEVRLVQPLRTRFVDGSSQRILVHPVQEALDDTESDEPSHVDPTHHVRMLHAPAFNTVPLPQRQIQLCQLRTTQLPLLFLLPPLPARPLPLTQSDIPRTLHLHLRTLDKRRHLGRRRIDGPEGENIQQKHAAVVEQMPDGLPHELEVGVRPQRNLLDAVDAVDPGQHAQHREVPVLVDEVLEPNGGEGDVVGVEGRGRRVGGEEFDVEGVGGVDGDHGFRVVVQVFEQDLAQGVDLAAVRGGVAIAGEELALLLEGAEEGV